MKTQTPPPEPPPPPRRTCYQCGQPADVLYVMGEHGLQEQTTEPEGICLACIEKASQS